MKKNLLSFWLMALMVMLGGMKAWAGDKTVVKYSFDDANSPSLTAGSRVSFDYDKTSVITSTKFLNAWNNTNGDPGPTTVSLGSTDLSGETWTLSFEWAAVGGCNSKSDHTTLKAGDTNLLDISGNSNWNTTVTLTYLNSDGTKTLPVPGCDKGKRFTAATGNQLNTTNYWHHFVITGGTDGVKLTITNSSTGAAVVENVVLSETNVNPTSLILEPCCGGAIGIDELSLTYYVEGEVIQTPIANYTLVDGINRTITATCDTEGAALYYSLDGENWTEGAVVTVSESGNVYFKAVMGSSESDVLTFEAVAGEAITLNAPLINRTSNTSVTITADQTNLLLSPDATITYEYGNEKASFTGSKTLAVTVDAVIAAYAEFNGYTTSETTELAVALFPEYVTKMENTATKTSGWSANAFSEETVTASERTYAALLLDDAQWGENIYLQTDGAWGLRSSGNWYINSDTQESWLLMQNMKKGDIIVVNVTYPASSTVNATYSKYSFGTQHAYEVTEDGNVELAFKKINAQTMDYLYGVYSYRPMSEEDIEAAKALAEAKAQLQTAIENAKALEIIESTDPETGDITYKENGEAVADAIADAEAALVATDATVESLAAAALALQTAVNTFNGAPAELDYYLVGNMTEWKANEAYKLTKNEAAEGVEEYMITLDLAADAQFKIVKSDGETIADDAWYPAGSGNNYGENGEITAAGNYTVYFRPNADGGEGWFYNVIYVAMKEEPIPTTTYKATFDNNADPAWENVYAYAWAVENDGEKDITVELLGAWPGTKLAKNEETGLYDVTIESIEEPKFIIFNNGIEGEGAAQTDDLAFENGKAYAFNEKAPAEDYTKYIVNADLAGEGGFDATGTKGIDGSGIVKVGNAAAFDFKQTIENLPAGKYLLTAKAAYRYGADEQAEYDAMQNTDVITKLVQLYATVGTKTVATPVQNRYDGASDTDYANGNGSVTVNGKFVPNSSNAVMAWFNFDQYINEVEFNLPADGAVTIGINRIGTPESDYTVIGPWTLTRLGDAEIEPEPVIADYYLVGNMTNWVTDGVKEEFKLTKNEEAAEGIEEYMINIELKADDEFKIVKPDGEEFVWYPAGENNNYKITSDGKYDIFFRPNADGGDDWYYNVIYVAKELLDMTDHIVNPSFETGDLTGWTVGSSSDTGVRENSNSTYTTVGCDGDYLFNTWWQGIPITQTVKDLPNGRYELRAKMTSDAGDHLFLLANGEHSAVFGSHEGKGVFVEQSMQFDVLDGTATIGAIGGNDDGSFNENGYFWYKADNFRLYFVEGVSLDKLVAAYEQALADAQAVTGDMNAEVKTALDAAIAANSEVDKTDADKLSAAIAALSEAAKAATASVDAYTKAAEILPKMKQLTESTNVYTQEAYDEYYGQWVAKYEAKTLTADEASALEDPFLVTGWRASVTVDNFLLSAWDTNPDFEDAPYYINTWSTEGENDGSGFKVPFFEYWTGDGDQLGERTLTATMTGLEPGLYEVSALVRVRAKNGYAAPAYGISLQANDGDLTDVAAGEQIGESQFYLKEFTAEGEVAEDGVLQIKLIVAGDNNISWLSFKDVNYTKKNVEPVPVSGTIDFQELCMKLGKGGPWAVNDGGDAGFTLGTEEAPIVMHYLGDYAEQGEAFVWGKRFAYEFVDGRGKFTFRNKNNKKDKNCGMFSWDYAHNFSILGLKDGDKVTITTLAGTTSFVSTNVTDEVVAGATVESDKTYTIKTEEETTRLDISMAAATLIAKIVIEPYGVETIPTITIDRETLALIPGESQKLVGTVDPAATVAEWKSSDETVATVAEDGTVTAVAAGEATISLSWRSEISDAIVVAQCVVTVADVDFDKYFIAKTYDFSTMGDVNLVISDEAAGAIWNEANSKTNNVFFCTNEGLEDIAVQAVAGTTGKGWSIADGQGLYLGSSAGRCAAIGGIKAGQIVEFIYTGDGFYTTSSDDGIDKKALNEATGRAIYEAKEDGMIGFEIVKGNYISKIVVYEPAAGYYLVGNMTEWAPSKDYKLTVNTAAEGVEYMITLDLAADAQFKIAYSDGATIADEAWYPTGTGNNYGENGEITAAGNYTVYFRPNADGGEDWFYNVIFAQYNGTVGIAGMKSEKNYQNDVIYTLNGQRVEKPRKGLYIVNGKKMVVK